VRLQTRPPRGITDKDLKLRRKIEEVVHWRPAAGSALEGKPGRGPEFDYVKYDEAK